MARIPMQMVYEPGQCDEPLKGHQRQALEALDEAFGRPAAFCRAEVITYFQQHLGWPYNQSHNAYAGLLARGLIQIADEPPEAYYNPFRETLHDIACECGKCEKELLHGPIDC